MDRLHRRRRLRLHRAVGLAGVLSLALTTTPGASQAAGIAIAPASTSVVADVVAPGITWTAAKLPDLAGTPPGGERSGYVAGIAGGASTLVAIGTDTAGGGNGTAAGVSWVSIDDGLTWVEHTIPGAPSLGGLVSAKGIFVAWAPNGFWTSLGGLGWARSGPGGIAEAALAPGLGGFLAFTRSTSGVTRAWKSNTGTSWHAAPDQTSIRGFIASGMAATNARIVAVGRDPANRARILVSTDGRTWSRATVPAGLRQPAFASVSFAGGAFRLIAAYRDATHNGTAVWSSSTGTSWTRRSFVPAAGGFPDLMSNVVRFGTAWFTAGFAATAAADDCIRRFWRTTDLIHWVRVNTPTPTQPGTCTKPQRSGATGLRMVVVGNSSDFQQWDGADVWVARPTP